MSMNRINKKSINKLSAVLGKIKSRKPRAPRKTPRKARVTKGVVKGKRRGGGNGRQGNKNYMASDGMNRSRVVTNNSVIEDTFQVRREKIANVNGTSAFTIAQSLYVNPGNSVLFPIFSQIAATYEEYRVNKLVFTFETDAYTAVSSTASAGKIILATNFDPDDATFSGDTQMENYCGSVKGPPYAPIIEHDLMAAGRSRRRGAKGDFALNNYFVYSSGNALAPVTGAGKFYDVGQFQVATSNNAVTTEIGELYVTYSFTMIRPKQQTPLGSNLLQAHIVESPAASAAAAGSAFLGTTGGVLRSGSTLPTVVTGNTFTLPFQGTYLVASAFIGSVTVVQSLGGGSAITGVQIMHDNATTSASGVSGSQAVSMIVFTVATSGTGAANTVTITGLTNLAAGTADIFISQISTGLTAMVQPGSDHELEVRMQRLEEMLARFEKPSHSLVVQTESDDDEFKENSLSRSVVIGLVDEALQKKSSSHKKV